MTARSALALALAASAVLTLAGCGAEGHSSGLASETSSVRSTSAPSPAATAGAMQNVAVTKGASYRAASVLARAFDTAGGSCRTFNADNTLTASSGECDDQGPGVAVAGNEKELAALLKQFRDDAATVGSTGNGAALVGPNWVIFGSRKHDLATLRAARPTLGGTVELY